MTCLRLTRGLIKAWFRELPAEVLDGLSPEQVLNCNSEEESMKLVKQLQPTESALLSWAINLSFLKDCESTNNLQMVDKCVLSLQNKSCGKSVKKRHIYVVYTTHLRCISAAVNLSQNLYCSILKDATGIAGNIFAFGLFLSPIPTFRRIMRNRSTENFSGLPYIYALLNCLICLWYGSPLVSSDNTLVLTVNSVGAVFQLTFTR
ncbi:hypothetical protein QQ045_006822 [Rhodiola kirilowii]